ncbi:hypothetical protein AVEN_83907-1 [Araneus ventricosus]|uniref:Uncharacterized protein n=1 Tax=Araneus ventricosus TaxID=182803 RepID=A0A4Y2I3Y8_ARAVE|nr:hypothetical protein AVEN_83907-1 [Araneus ventricosus]
MDPQILNSHLQIMYRVTQRHLVLQLIPHMLYRIQVRGEGRPWKSLNMTQEVLSNSSCGRALSCWKIAPGRPFRKGFTWGRRMSST